MVYVVADGDAGSTVREGINANFSELFAATVGLQSDQAKNNYYFGGAGNLTNIGGACVAGGFRSLLDAVNVVDATVFGDNAARHTTGSAGVPVVGITAIGKFACEENLTGTNWTAVGDSSGRRQKRDGCSYYGYGAGQWNVNGQYGLWMGAGSGGTGDQGDYETIGGYSAGQPSGGSKNAIWGSFGKYAGSGIEDAGIGHFVLYNSTGGKMTAAGAYAGFTINGGTRSGFWGESCGNNVLQKLNPSNAWAFGGYGSYSTKDNQIVLGNANITETNLRGKTVVNSGLGTPRAWLDVVGNDSSYLLGLSGATHGLRINANAIELQIQAVDAATLSSNYMPLTFMSSSLAFFGGPAVVKQTLPAAATNAGETQTLVNAIRTAILNYNLAA